MWQSIVQWFFSLGPKYGVNPIIFGVIYVGAIPFFTLSVAWLIRNLRGKKPVLIPLFAASLCFVSAYLYLAVAGKNIPVWVYLFLGAMISYGVYSTVRKIQRSVPGPR